MRSTRIDELALWVVAAQLSSAQLRSLKITISSQDVAGAALTTLPLSFALKGKHGYALTNASELAASGRASTSAGGEKL
jgi:hypothetical protein